jgi:flagellar basal-body rod protein FlgF
MDSGYYAAMTGLVARTQALDIAATNLANSQTPATAPSTGVLPFRADGARCCGLAAGRTVNNFGLLGGDRLNLGQGALQQTGNPLDLAIEGEGFFQVQTRTGFALRATAAFTAHPADNW